MIISLIRTWTTKVRNSLYEIINWIRCKRSSSSSEYETIPQYQYNDWGNRTYGYVPIANNKSTFQQSNPIIHHHHVDTKDGRKQGIQNQATVCTLSVNHHQNAIKYTATTHNHALTSTNSRISYQDTIQKRDLFHEMPMLNNVSTKKITTETIIKNNKVPPPSLQPPLVVTEKKKKNRGETSRQRRLRRKKQKETDAIISTKTISFNDNDAKYAAMRTKAHEALVKKIATRKESEDAFKKGNKKLGRELFEKSRTYHNEMIKLNKQAADHKYKEKNKGRPCHVIDLHGLFVSEARERVKDAIKKCKLEKKKEMTLIVGNGNHSHDKVSKLKPAMMDYIKSLRLQCVPNKPNSGCLLVQLAETSLTTI